MQNDSRMPTPSKIMPRTRSLAAPPVALALLVSVLLAGLYGCTGEKAGTSTVKGTASTAGNGLAASLDTVLARYAGSESCRECHPTQFGGWDGSHHALAERDVDPERDRSAFDPTRRIAHGKQTSIARVRDDGGFELETLGLSGRMERFPLERVFGVFPLYQFLAPTGQGRYQATELAFDPVKSEWFDVYGDEDRMPGEWGHWTGRGMNWNSMCASCHNTALFKNYDFASDTYDTKRAEMGVGCEACHGPLAAHVGWQRERGGDARGDPHVERIPKEQVLPTCGSCHSRRSDLTGRFAPGERYLDHYSPTIVDESEIYYADGQVLEEDFEYVSFLGSRMRKEGVLCINCHDPHTAKPLFEGNQLCLQCHKDKIDPAAHSHHVPGTPGGNCVDCHMPITTYMQRHPRHDHGFTIPDPLLTKEHGIPNACNRCHTDQPVDAMLEAVERWYGQRMNRITRKRARAVANARARNDGAAETLLIMAREEEHPFWRAVLGGMLKLWPEDERSRSVLIGLTRDEDPLVRGTAARALEAAVGLPEVDRALAALLGDPVRMVRVHAAWALRRRLDPGSTAGGDLWRMLSFNLDQPGGALQMAVYTVDRGSPRAALGYFERAVRWDPRSPGLRENYAVCLSIAGKPVEAEQELARACELAPEDGMSHFRLGLARNELGRVQDAIGSFETAVKVAPELARAWYNLGLARVKIGALETGVEAIEKAESIEPANPEFPYARATVLARMERVNDAIEATQKALSIDPDYAPAQQLLSLLVPENG